MLGCESPVSSVFFSPQRLFLWVMYCNSISYANVLQGSADEMNRGYFADISELKQHGGKVFVAEK